MTFSSNPTVYDQYPSTHHRLKYMYLPAEIQDHPTDPIPYKTLTYGTDPSQRSFGRVTQELICGRNEEGSLVEVEKQEFSYYAAGDAEFADDNGGSNGTASGVNRALFMTRQMSRKLCGLAQYKMLEKTDHYFNYAGQSVRTVRYDSNGVKHISDIELDTEGNDVASRAEDAVSSGTTQYLGVNDYFRIWDWGGCLSTRPTRTTQTGCGCGGNAGSESDHVTDYTYEILNGEWRTKDEYPADAPNEKLTTTRWFDYQEMSIALAKVPLAKKLFGVDNPDSAQQQAVADLLGFLGVPMGLGDINGDGAVDQCNGNLIKEALPPVTTGSGQQTRVRLTAYDSQNHLRYEINETGVRTDYTCDSIGNIIKRVDDANYDGRTAFNLPDPVQAKWTFSYDARGNKISEITPRGVRTDFKYNLWNEPIETKRAAAIIRNYDTNHPEPASAQNSAPPLVAYGLVTRNEYDANGQLIHVSTEDRGEMAGCGPYVEQTFFFDAPGHKRSEVSGSLGGHFGKPRAITMTSPGG